MIAALLLCLGVCVPAFADDMDSSPEEDWDQITAAVLEAYGVSPDNVRAGYRNLVTGEEHYLNGDEYTVAASMFKVPLCMIIADKVQQGELDWSTDLGGISVKDLMDSRAHFSVPDMDIHLKGKQDKIDIYFLDGMETGN